MSYYLPTQASDYYTTSDVSIVRNQLVGLAKDEYFNMTKDSLIQIKGLVAAWMITLQSHIDAGAGI
jgi:hypothetical protein